MTVRVLEKYKSEVVPALRARFAYKNPMMMPKIVKVVINIGVGDAKSDSKFIDAAAAELATISGQRPMIKKSKKSIANFKLREGSPVGCSVTLRGVRMWEFLDYSCPHQGLSGRFENVLRRTRQLQSWPQGSADFPRDQLR